MRASGEQKKTLGFTMDQLEALTGKSYHRLLLEAKVDRVEIKKFIHGYEAESDRLLVALLTSK